MKPSTLILGGLVLALTVGGIVALFYLTEPARTRAKLVELEGADLREVPGPTRIRVDFLFNRFADPKASGIERTPCDPLTVLRLGPDTAAEQILLVRTMDIDRDQSVMIWDFQTGFLDARVWECNSKIESMRGTYRSEVDTWCVETVISKSGEKTRHFRFFRDGFFVLLRVEDEKGRALPMPQELRFTPAIGEAEEWASLLTSYQGAELVLWLAWLKAPGRRDEMLKEPVLRTVLEKYSRSPNLWVREAAELALSP